MSNQFFERPIVNSPYESPRQHWELDESGQPTGNLIERRRRAEFVTPIPKPKKRSFHKLDKAKDKRFWSVRVNSDILLIVHRTWREDMRDAHANAHSERVRFVLACQVHCICANEHLIVKCPLAWSTTAGGTNGHTND